MECKSYGPFFSGIRDEACAIQGGTFCPITNSTVLKECVKADYDEVVVGETQPAFANYLSSMPRGAYLSCPDDDESCLSDSKELNVTDSFGCGRAREYFGFDSDFINDKQICRDIKQFQSTRDFEFLEEFFDQSGARKPEGPGLNQPLVPPLILQKPLAGKLCV
jgi:hypothetical protein